MARLKRNDAPTLRYISVARLMEILQTLPPQAILHANRLGNLNVHTTGHLDSDHNPDLDDWEWIGFIEFGDETYTEVQND